jgi:hypothetical protein
VARVDAQDGFALRARTVKALLPHLACVARTAEAAVPPLTIMSLIQTDAALWELCPHCECIKPGANVAARLSWAARSAWHPHILAATTDALDVFRCWVFARTAAPVAIGATVATYLKRVDAEPCVHVALTVTLHLLQDSSVFEPRLEEVLEPLPPLQRLRGWAECACNEGGVGVLDSHLHYDTHVATTKAGSDAQAWDALVEVAVRRRAGTAQDVVRHSALTHDVLPWHAWG